MFHSKILTKVLAGVLAVLLLSGCSPVSQEVSTFARVYSTRGLGQTVAEGLSERSSESSESSEESSESSSREESSAQVVVIPAPAPEQPITRPVLEDPKFKPTEETKKEEPQKGGGDGGSGGGTVIVPEQPGSSSSFSSESASSTPSSESSSSSLESSSPGAVTKPEGWHMIGGIGYYYNAQGAISSRKGIDVSSHNGNINWKLVKEDGVEFAIIRCGVRGYGTEVGSGNMVLDAKFKYNIEQAQANGIEVSVYFFTQAITTKEAVDEASFVLSAIKGYNVKYVVFDTEKAYPVANDPIGICRGNLIDAKLRTDCTIAFCEKIKSSGYTPMIYSNASWFSNNLELSRLSGYKIWLARWLAVDAQLTWVRPFDVWQYASDGTVKGISGNVDVNAWKIG